MPTITDSETAVGSDAPLAYRSLIIDDAPTSYWRLDESSGTTAHDQMLLNTGAEQNPGAYQGTAPTNYVLGQAGAIAGDSDTAVKLLATGGTGYLYLSNGVGVQLSTGSFECWIKTTQAGDVNYHAIFAKNPAYFFGLLVTTGRLGIFDYGNNVARDTGKSINDGNWHHVAFTWQSGVTNGTIIYLDGEAVLTTTMLISSQANAAAIAATPGVGQLLPGTYDEAALYNKVLTPTQIQNHYRAGALTGPGSLISFAGADTGVGAETSSRLLTAAETGSGADAVVTVATGSSDTASGAEGTAWVVLSSAEVGAASEASALVLADSDTGSGLEAQLLALATVDMGAGVEGWIMALRGADSATGIETELPRPSDCDTGSGDDAERLALSSGETGTGVEAVSGVDLDAADDATGSEAEEPALASSDAGVGDENEQLILLSDDAGTGVGGWWLTLTGGETGSVVDEHCAVSLAGDDVAAGVEDEVFVFSDGDDGGALDVSAPIRIASTESAVALEIAAIALRSFEIATGREGVLIGLVSADEAVGLDAVVELVGLLLGIRTGVVARGGGGVAREVTDGRVAGIMGG